MKFFGVRASSLIQNNAFRMIPNSLHIKIKSVTNFLIIFFIFKQLQSQISQSEINGYNPFCDETLHMYV